MLTQEDPRACTEQWKERADSRPVTRDPRWLGRFIIDPTTAPARRLWSPLRQQGRATLGTGVRFTGPSSRFCSDKLGLLSLAG